VGGEGLVIHKELMRDELSSKRHDESTGLWVVLVHFSVCFKRVVGVVFL
jgi:hypothetical protein